LGNSSNLLTRFETLINHFIFQFDLENGSNPSKLQKKKKNERDEAKLEVGVNERHFTLRVYVEFNVCYYKLLIKLSRAPI
jgi:hypothetical protein